MPTLILSTANDLHAAAVAAKLDTLSEPYELLELENLLEADVRFDMSAKVFSVQTSEKRLDLHSFRSIWNRRTGAIKSPPLAEEWVEKFVEHESNRAWWGMMRTLDAFWVNHPDKQSETLFKVSQVDAAEKCGLRVPPSVMTNNPTVAREFYEKCGGKVIYKMIDEASWLRFPETELPRGIATMAVREKDVAHFDQVKFGIHLFQQRIDKVADIRVTVIGQNIFAALIDSQKGQGTVDFRLDYSVPVERFELPDEIKRSLLQLMQSLGLNFGAADFSLDTSGDFYFFEINPAGQFLWIEEATGYPMAEALARLLARLDQPLVNP